MKRKETDRWRGKRQIDGEERDRDMERKDTDRWRGNRQIDREE